MKLLLTGDWHLTDKAPEKRVDNYTEIQYNKIKYILDIAKKEKVAYVLQPGDFFESHKASNYLIQQYIDLFKSYNIQILGCFGQHCLRYHSANVFDTPSAILQSAGVLTLIHEKFLKNDFPKILNDNVHIYGASWNEPTPKIQDESKFNVLLVHRMIIKNKKLWKAQEQYQTALSLLKEDNFNLVVSGDNHSSFVVAGDSQVLFNCGSLMRSTVAQTQHKPVVYIFNTETLKYSTHLIPIEENVFNLDELTVEKEKNEELLITNGDL